MSQPKRSQKDKQPNLFRITLSPDNAEWVRSELKRRGWDGIAAAHSLIINEAIAAARTGSTLPAPPQAPQTAQPIDGGDDDMFTFAKDKL